MDAVSSDRSRTERREDSPPLSPGHEDESHVRDRSDAAPPARASRIEKLRRNPWVIAAVVIILLAVAAAGLWWWLEARIYESTDDAFVDSRVGTISSQVAGAIGEVDVTDNEAVEAGAVLMRIEDGTYRAQVAQAEANVDAANANIANLDAQIAAQDSRIAQANGQVEQAKAALTFAQQEFNRAQNLVKSGAGTVQQAQQTRSSLTQGQAALDAAQANAAAEQKQLAVLRTQRRAADAQLAGAKAQQRLADLNLAHTVITAPVAGRITKLTAAKGLYVQPGQALSMIVPNEVWITANFKETQLAHMQPGQPVEISVDAYPDRTFHGHVDSIQAGSGTAFSLLPAENATGNFVKVVQRVPVKIVFDTPPQVELGPGMSVVPMVKVR